MTEVNVHAWAGRHAEKLRRRANAFAHDDLRHRANDAIFLLGDVLAQRDRSAVPPSVSESLEHFAGELATMMKGTEGAEEKVAALKVKVDNYIEHLKLQLDRATIEEKLHQARTALQAVEEDELIRVGPESFLKQKFSSFLADVNDIPTDDPRGVSEEQMCASMTYLEAASRVAGLLGLESIQELASEAKKMNRLLDEVTRGERKSMYLPWRLVKKWDRKLSAAIDEALKKSYALDFVQTLYSDLQKINGYFGAKVALLQSGDGEESDEESDETSDEQPDEESEQSS